jgi:hypothetical protein
VLDQARHAVGAEGPEPFLLAGARHEPRVEERVLLRARERIVEVHLHLEQLAEILVERVEQVVDERSADEDDLHAERIGSGARLTVLTICRSASGGSMRSARS